MARKLIINHTCPYCHNSVENIPNYVLKKAEQPYNVEWVQLKRGVKQYFHTECFKKTTIKYRQKQEA